MAGEEVPRETTVLLAAAPTHKARILDMSAVLSAFTTIASTHWSKGATGALLEWAEPVDPAILARRFKSIAAAPGHLTLHLAGQLLLHRTRNTLYLALSRTTAPTLESTGLPLHALASRLRRRPAGSTTVFVDLVAEAEVWRRVRYAGFTLGPGVRLYGALSPPPRRKRLVDPAYLTALADTLAGDPWLTPAKAHARAATAGTVEGRMLVAQEPLLRPGFVSPETDTEAALAPGQDVPPDGTTNDGPPLADDPVLRLPAEELDHLDPHTAIVAAAQDGRHAQAAAAAAIWEEAALRSHGPGSAPAVHWLEVRAEVAHLAGEPALSCQLWLGAARVRLDVGQEPSHPDVVAAVDRAQHQFHQITLAHQAWQLAPEVLRLRRHVPSVQKGALETLEARTAQLERSVAAGRMV